MMRWTCALVADVDAVRRLVEDEDAWVGGEPLAEHDLLAVAAGERRHRVVSRRALMARSPASLARGPSPCRGRATPRREMRSRTASVMLSGSSGLGDRDPDAVAVFGQVGEAELSICWGARGERRVDRCAVDHDLAGRGCRSPTIAWAISERPAPTRPAMPTISPARTVNEMSANAPVEVEIGRRGAARVRRRFRTALAKSWSRARPTINRTISSSVSSAAGRVATCAPSRRTVTSSAKPSSSSRRWEMSMIEAPRAGAADDPEELLRLRRRQRRGRLVEDEEPRAPTVMRAGDLDELHLADGEAEDQADARRDGRRAYRGGLARARRFAAAPTVPSRVNGWMPMKMFSATSRWGKSFGS